LRRRKTRSTAAICALALVIATSPSIASESLAAQLAPIDIAYKPQPTLLYGTPTLTGPRDLSWRSHGDDPMDRTCPQLYVDHPYITEFEHAPTVESVRMRASFYGNNFHGGILDDEDQTTNALFHECDATVVAYNSLPKGTVLRLTNRDTGRTILVVIQDFGGPQVKHRLDLSRGAAQALDPLYWKKGILKNLNMEILGKPTPESGT
jgi:rare lipoprotein A (peptidoglycan hydrolase)